MNASIAHCGANLCHVTPEVSGASKTEFAKSEAKVHASGGARGQSLVQFLKQEIITYVDHSQPYIGEFAMSDSLANILCRALAFLFLRYTLIPLELWTYLKPFILDSTSFPELKHKTSARGLDGRLDPPPKTRRTTSNSSQEISE